MYVSTNYSPNETKNICIIHNKSVFNFFKFLLCYTDHYYKYQTRIYISIIHLKDASNKHWKIWSQRTLLFLKNKRIINNTYAWNVWLFIWQSVLIISIAFCIIYPPRLSLDLNAKIVHSVLFFWSSSVWVIWLVLFICFAHMLTSFRSI